MGQLEDNRIAERQLSLYLWFKQNLKTHSMHLYHKPGIVIPVAIRSYPAVCNQWFVSDFALDTCKDKVFNLIGRLI